VSCRYCFAERVERARSNISVDDPERPESQDPKLLTCVPVRSFGHGGD
jgi:hypothetical protein